MAPFMSGAYPAEIEDSLSKKEGLPETSHGQQPFNEKENRR